MRESISIKKKPKKKNQDFILKIGLFFSVFLTFSAIAYSQKYEVVQQGLIPINLNQMNTQKSEENKVNNLFEKIDGTYQIQCFKNDYKVMFSESLYQKIISSRKTSENIYLELDEHSRLFLPSEAAVQALGFKKLENILYTSK